MGIGRELEVSSRECFDHSCIWSREPAGGKTPKARLPDEFGLAQKRAGEVGSPARLWSGRSLSALDMGGRSEG